MSYGRQEAFTGLGGPAVLDEISELSGIDLRQKIDEHLLIYHDGGPDKDCWVCGVRGKHVVEMLTVAGGIRDGILTPNVVLDDRHRSALASYLERESK